MKIDIVGNGASIALYQDRGYKVIACNIPRQGLRFDSLSIIDHQPIHWMKTNDWRPGCEIYCTENVVDTARGMELDLRPVYQRLSRMNSGLYAAEYASKTYREINLWGMDSLWSDDLTSEMDSKVPRHTRPKLNQWWRPHWVRIFRENPDNSYIIHAPQGAQNAFTETNVTITEHMALDIRDHSTTS